MASLPALNSPIMPRLKLDTKAADRSLEKTSTDHSLFCTLSVSFNEVGAGHSLNKVTYKARPFH